MEERTIGQVLQTAREEFSLSLADVQEDLKIQKRYLLALESDDFDDIPSATQTRHLLARYADYLDLEVTVVLEAFDNDTPLLVYAMDRKKTRQKNAQRRRRRKRKPSYLPLFYLLLIAFAIVSFVAYTVWQYHQTKKPSLSSSSSYQVEVRQSESQSSPSGSTEPSSESSETPTESSSSSGISLSLVSSDGNHMVVDVSSPTTPQLTLSIDQTSSWISLSGTELADGLVLSPEQPTTSVTLDKEKIPSTILTLGVVEGVTVQVGDQVLDLSSLTGASATITLNLK